MVKHFREWATHGTIYAGSDRSVMETIGEHGFAFRSGIKQTKIWGGGVRTVGNRKEMIPLRAEPSDSIATIMVLHILQVVTNINLQVELWIDNAEVLRRNF